MDVNYSRQGIFAVIHRGVEIEPQVSADLLSIADHGPLCENNVSLEAVAKGLTDLCEEIARKEADESKNGKKNQSKISHQPPQCCRFPVMVVSTSRPDRECRLTLHSVAK